MQTPSGLRPWRICFTMGLQWPCGTHTHILGSALNPHMFQPAGNLTSTHDPTAEQCLLPAMHTSSAGTPPAAAVLIPCLLKACHHDGEHTHPRTMQSMSRRQCSSCSLPAAAAAALLLPPPPLPPAAPAPPPPRAPRASPLAAAAPRPLASPAPDEEGGPLPCAASCACACRACAPARAAGCACPGSNP